MKYTKLSAFYLFLKNKAYSSRFFCVACKIFTLSNLNKVLIIFTFGLASRIFIVYMYNINVFIEYSNIYYYLFSLFIVVVHEVVHHFNFNIIPSHIIALFKIILIMFEDSKLKLGAHNQTDSSVKSRINKPSISNVLNMDGNSSSTNSTHNPNIGSSRTRNTSNWIPGATRSTPVGARASMYIPSTSLMPPKPIEFSNILYGFSVKNNIAFKELVETFEHGKPSGWLEQYGKEEVKASDQRWLKERSEYPHLTHTEWVKLVDADRFAEILSRRVKAEIDADIKHLEKASELLSISKPLVETSLRETHIQELLETFEHGKSSGWKDEYAREEKIASNQRWINEKSKYPHLTQTEWVKHIDLARSKENMTIRLKAEIEVDIRRLEKAKANESLSK